MYKLTANPDEIRKINDDGSSVTIPRGHRLWQEYENWLAEGNAVEPIETTDEISARMWQVRQVEAQAALTKSDVTILRCIENAVAVPSEWATYRATLRDIIKATSGDASKPMPQQPSYPKGT